MRSIASPRVATCVVAVAFASVPAVILPSNAAADDGAGASDVVAAALQGTGVEVALPEGGDTAGVADAALGSVMDATEAETAPTEVPASDPATQPAPSTQPMSSVSGAQIPVVEPDSKVDTTASSVDTTPDTVTTGPTAPSSPAAVQTAPTNVNVSVRIESAGDNGPVTQTNIAAVASTGATATSRAATTGPVSAVPSAATPATAATLGQATAPATAAQDDPDTWSWQWDCVSVPAISMISPDGSNGSSVPRNWTWIWNCDGNAEQYQGATVGQYQPSNVNVSIRVASPGNDGPVSQANVAFAVGAGVSVPHGASTPATSDPPVTLPFPVPVPVVSLPAIPGVAAIPGLPAVLSPVVTSFPQPSTETGVAALVTTEVAPDLGDVDGLALVTPPALGPGDVSMLARDVPRLPALRPGWSAATEPSPPTSGVWNGTASTALPAADVAGRTAKVSGKRRHKPAPQWRMPAPTTPTPAQAPSGTSAAAAGAGGSSGGGLPLFLALPFVVAVLDLARRVALERVATPSGHRSRMPDDPG